MPSDVSAPSPEALSFLNIVKAADEEKQNWLHMQADMEKGE